MTPERLEEIRARDGLGSCAKWREGVDDRAALLAEVDRLRGVLERIVDDSGDAYHHARRALEGTP